MKKLILCGLLIFFNIKSSLADICYDISKDTVEKAYAVINKQTEVYSYCSICPDAEPRKIVIHEIRKGNPLIVNGEEVDLAHLYYKKDNQFINVGVASGCIPADKYGIKAKLDNLSVIHRTEEEDRAAAKERAEKTYETCITENTNTRDHITTADMVVQNTLINDCLEKAVKHEIEQGFEIEIRKEMYQYLENARKNIFKFYLDFYSANKYCDGRCGSYSVLLPYIDEGEMLKKMLEKLFYLNITKNGY